MSIEGLAAREEMLAALRSESPSSSEKSIDEAVAAVVLNANKYRDKHPTLRTLLAELAELAYALEGEHQHTPEQELVQIGGIAINWLRRIYAAKRERKHPSNMKPMQDR